jgi:hypothetical protein
LRYDQLEHAIRAACDVSGDTEILIFGSQAILGNFQNVPESLRASIEVDVQPRNLPDMADYIDGALGEESQFHITHGFYVHGVSIEVATLPDGWQERMIPISHPIRTHGKIGLCIEIHDLAASKLFAYREKDRVFVTTLLIENLIDINTLILRIKALSCEIETCEKLIRWAKITHSDIH